MQNGTKKERFAFEAPVRVQFIKELRLDCMRDARLSAIRQKIKGNLHLRPDRMHIAYPFRREGTRFDAGAYLFNRRSR